MALPKFGSGDLVERVLKGEHAAIAAALSQMEDTRPTALDTNRELLRELEERTPRTHTVVGLTGTPGVGKSSLAAAMIRYWVEKQEGVGMLAIDPSSRRSGGALLGDRTRLRFEPNERVFVRSLAAKDQLGGLAPATRASVVVLRAAFEWTLVETVGVGQSEIDVETVADTVVLVLQPGSGDTLQFMKAGVLEIPDISVVHKWDLGSLAERTRADLEAILGQLPVRSTDWRMAVIGTSAQTGQGIDELGEKLREHRAYLDATNELDHRRQKSRTAWTLELFTQRFGSFGLERLGGRDATIRRIEELDQSPLDGFHQLRSEAGFDR